MKFKIYGPGHKRLYGRKARKYLKKMSALHASQIEKSKLNQEIKEKNDYYEDKDFIFTLIK